MTFEKYKSRFQAGTRLASLLEDNNPKLYERIQKRREKIFCFAIPNGGVPVSEGFCSVLSLKYDLLILRKIKIPYNPEAGFGSITTDGSLLLNETLLSKLNLSQKEIENSIETTKEEIRVRLRYYGKSDIEVQSYSNRILDKYIFLIDDGLASGFTMLAAIKMVRNYNPQKIIVLAPTAPFRTIQKIQEKVDTVICANIKRTIRFAVAQAYKNWYDLTEKEVLEILQKSDYFIESKMN
jgi:predicted phosphoribosyltransferase